MAKYDGATIEVVKWSVYNPRTDSKKPSWFRFENDLAIGSAFFGLDCEQKWLWVFILSLVSKANGDPITWNTAYCQQLTGIESKKQDETIEVFEKFVRLRVSRNVTRSSTSATRPLRTNETNETNERGGHKKKKTSLTGVRLVYPPNFEEVWVQYQAGGEARGDKQESLAAFLKADLSDTELVNLKKAITGYASKTDRQYRVHFQRFLKSDWRVHIQSVPSAPKFVFADSTEVSRG